MGGPVSRTVYGPRKRHIPGNGHPVMFGFEHAEDFGPFPDGGGYPLRFLERAYALLGVTDPDRVLHLCSGSVRRGVTVDVRPEVNPTVVADARHTPFPDASFRWVLTDPPYSEEYARNLYGTEAHYPEPGAIMAEAARLLEPGGRVGMLHFEVPMIRRPLRLVGVWGVTTGLGYKIRAFTVAEKRGQAKRHQDRLTLTAPNGK